MGERAKSGGMDEDALVDELRKIERGLAGEGAVGAEACRAELDQWRKREPDEEFRLSVPTPTAQRVLVAWCRRCGITPYRAPRQRKTTISVRVPKGFMNQVMWPRIEAMALYIDRQTSAAVQRVVERWAGVSLAEHVPGSAQADLFEDDT